MEIFEVSPEAFDSVIESPYHVFARASFNKLNASKAHKVYYLLFKKKKIRLGLIVGTHDKIIKTPFSAPFGGFTFLTEDVKLQYLEEAIALFEKWAAERQFESVSITLPPSFYHNSFISKQLNCLWRNDFVISQIDLNYAMYVEDFDDKYLSRIWYNARKNLRSSLEYGMRFHICSCDEEKELAYDIIRKNRERRGYPLRMTWQQVLDTSGLIKADFFIVYTKELLPVAAAIVFHINQEVVQVIYWGDLDGYQELRPMNFLSYKVFEYFKSSGIKVVDIGPSTEYSVPNYGLCEFKESIGCRIDPKYTFFKSFN